MAGKHLQVVAPGRSNVLWILKSPESEKWSVPKVNENNLCRKCTCVRVSRLDTLEYSGQ